MHPSTPRIVERKVPQYKQDGVGTSLVSRNVLDNVQWFARFVGTVPSVPLCTRRRFVSHRVRQTAQGRPRKTPEVVVSDAHGVIHDCSACFVRRHKLHPAHAPHDEFPLLC